MSRPTGKGKACQACSTFKVRCSLAGRSTAVDPEVIKGIVNEAMGVLNKTVCKQSHAIKEMSTELFSWNVHGRPIRDEEWSEESETLENWRLWGQPGSVYQHLPKVTHELLRPQTEAASVGISSGELQEIQSTDRRIRSGEEDPELTAAEAFGNLEDDVAMQEAGQGGPEPSTVEDSSDEESSSDEEDEGVKGKPPKSVDYPDE